MMVKETKDIVLSEEYIFGEGHKKYNVTTQRTVDEGKTTVKVMRALLYNGPATGITIHNSNAYLSKLCEDGLLSGLVPDGKTAFGFLEELCHKGFSEKYPNVTEDVHARLAHELEVINKKGMVGGFLIIYDLIEFARSNNLMISPGCGALPGSLVAYCLGITGVDPIKENLLFERYLNMGRETPSYCIRIDVEKGAKPLIFGYLTEMYGSGMPKLLKMADISIKEWVELSIIKDTLEIISRSKRERIDIVRIDKTDPAVFELLLSGETNGILFFDKDDPHSYSTWWHLDDNGKWHEYHEPLVAGNAALYEVIRPKNMDELMAAITLDRPLSEEHIEKYLRNIKNSQYITYECPELETILSTTYGCVIYQEQIMRILQDLGGFSPEKSDLCRRDLSKRKQFTIGEMREEFVYGATSSKIVGMDVANAIFDMLWDKARYSFNKSHVAAFSLMIYEMAWLKLYYRSEFMEAAEKYRGIKSDILP
ncbi:DNA polymerase III-associated protein (plasmid) [Butyrivibrio proteoclasticus B316]|uniref:DNA polymerase III-associated protein n=1 Tax=Butyrivibrio proteoclasticus (strain ATCC 51982 / DSM 14932 / B316) TaxID=515622 RepID=E0S512_BUTPB|nr:hypothetical protein [Butyrivibrio proteoclasticus]ADL36494.1 DNA polymerase III-associated protein [Butyrivibrio proteoclasticus B316]